MKRLGIVAVELALVVGMVVGHRRTTATVVNSIASPDTWATKASMPTARAYLAAAVANNKIYAIGGDATAHRTEEGPQPRRRPA